MRILDIEQQPIHELRYLNAARGGGVVSERLPVLRGRVDALPEHLDALVCTADLQGVAASWRHGGENVLLGIELAEVLADLADAGTVPDSSRTGVILAGDLYSAPGGDKRGASGDVRDVWLAFASLHRWVVGVAGNHDRFGSEREQRRFEATEGLVLLDGAVTAQDDLQLGGVGNIIGNPSKPGRCDEDEFLTAVEMVAEQSPDILVLHQGPGGGRTQRGHELVHRVIDARYSGVVICGHVHWRDPMATLGGGAQVLNVDARVVVLTSHV